MAYESVTANAGIGGADFAVDTVDSKQIPIGKIDAGGDGLSVPIIAGRQADAASLPVALSDEDVAILDAIKTKVEGSIAVTGTFYQATQPVSIATAPALVASSAIIGNVRIDQTTPGTTNGVQVNAALPAGTNAIGKLAANSGVDIGDVDILSIAAGDNNIGNVDVVTLPSPISGPGNPTIDSYTSAAINVGAASNTSIISAPGANKQIWIYGLAGTANVAGSVSLQDEDDTAITGVMPVGITGGWVLPLSGNFSMPWKKVATNKAVELDTVTCEFDGIVAYAIVSV